MTKKYLDAQGYFSTVLAENPNSVTALAGNAWIQVFTGALSQGNPFEQCLDKSIRDLESLVGYSHYLRSTKKLKEALNTVNTIIGYYPNFLPAFIERMNIHFEMQNWEAVLESAQRLGGMSPENIDSMLMISLYELCCEGTSDSISTYLDTTKKAIEKLEPNNAELYYSIANSFAKLANKNSKIVNVCVQMVQKAIQIDGTKGEYHSALGFMYGLLGDLNQSKSAYDNACKLDPQSVFAMEGLIEYSIQSENFQSASDQLELFNEIQGSAISERICYLNAVLYQKQNQMSDKALIHLREALKVAFAKMKRIPFSFEAYSILNPGLLLDITEEYLKIVQSLDDKNMSYHTIAEELLSMICKMVPGSTEARFLVAKAKILLNDPIAAEKQLLQCISKSKSNYKAQLLMAEIYIQKKNYSGALSALDMALSFDFQIRHRIDFVLLKAKCLNGLESYSDAIILLKSALQLPQCKEAIKAIEKNEKWNKSPTHYEVSSLYILLIGAQTNSKQRDEASMTMDYAFRLFSGTMYESYFVLEQAKNAIVNGNIQLALDILTAIKPKQSYTLLIRNYLEARSIMADIYLNHRHDRKKYASCFREVVDQNPTVESCLLLGDAYMKIQEPEQAIAVYQAALKYNPQSVFVQKVGQAYALMHNYSKAISYYKTAISGASAEESYSLRVDLASLLQKLKRYEECQVIIEEALSNLQSQSDTLQKEADLKQMKAELFKNMEMYPQALDTYLQSKESQMILLSRALDKDSEMVLNKIVETCIRMAEISELYLKDYDKAISFYNEAAHHQEKNEKALLALSKLYIRRNNTASAQELLQTVLKNFPGSEEASELMGDLLFGTASFQSALYHYYQILEKNPSNFEVLAKYVDVCRRTNKLELADEILNKGTLSTSKAKLGVGYHYCRGIYFRHSSRLNEALKEFVLCKKDNIWGERTMIQMVEIFLNPGNETIGGDALASAIDNSASTSNLNTEAELLGAITAEKLLREFTAKTNSLQTQILYCQVMMASKQKDEIERAINIQMEMLNSEREYVPAILGTAVGFMLLKQTPRARNQLKRLAKTEWNLEFGESIEKSWLLLADIYIQGGKYDLAVELLKKVTNVNQSCSKAWEYLGFIMEKEQAYKDAADYYLKCWNLEKQSNPTIGFKLAFNYLKAKRFTDAVDISHLVLRAYPDYPKIKGEILQKARNSLRFP